MSERTFSVDLFHPNFDSIAELAVALVLVPVFENILLLPIWIGLTVLSDRSEQKTALVVLTYILIGLIAYISHGQDIHALPATLLFLGMTFFWTQASSKQEFARPFFYTVVMHMVFNLLTVLLSFVFE